MRPHLLDWIHRRTVRAGSEEPQPWVRSFDKFLIVIAVVAPLINLPQLYKILAEKTSAGVSVLSWSLFAVFAIPWIVYGIVHREKPIVVAYVLWLALDLAVVYAALLYS